MERFQPSEDFRLRQLDLLGDAEFGKICGEVGFLGFQLLHAGINAVMGDLRGVNQSVHQLVQLFFELGDGTGELIHAGIGEFFFILGDDGAGYAGSAGRGQDKAEGPVDDILLQGLFFLVLFVTGMVFLFVGAGVIVMDFTVAGAARFTDEGRAAIGAEGAALEQVNDAGFGFSRGAGVEFGDLLDLFEGGFVDQRRRNARNNGSGIGIFADIDGICQGFGE